MSDCQVCDKYAATRGRRIQREIDKVARTVEEFDAKWAGFMSAFHARHQRINRQRIVAVANRERVS